MPLKATLPMPPKPIPPAVIAFRSVWSICLYRWGMRGAIRLEYRIYNLVDYLIEIFLLDTAEAAGHVALYIAR